MDDIRPPRPTTNYQSANNRPSCGPNPLQQTNAQATASPAPTQPEDNQPQPLQNSSSEDHHYALPQSKKSSTGLIIALVVFILLFIGSLAFAGYQYMQNKQLKEDISELQSESKRLTQKIYSLEYDNKDLNQKLDMAEGDISSLEETKQLILTTCGSACSNILH
jgi:cell division protein FtsB